MVSMMKAERYGSNLSVLAVTGHTRDRFALCPQSDRSMHLNDIDLQKLLNRAEVHTCVRAAFCTPMSLTIIIITTITITITIIR